MTDAARARSGSKSAASGSLRVTRSGVRRSEKVSENLARQIVDDMQSLPAGTALPSESAMLESYQVGRPSLREALRLLEINGLIVMRPGPGGGPRVADVDSTHYARMTSLYLHRSLVTYRDVLEVREFLEPLMASRAAMNPEPEGVQRLMDLAHSGANARTQREHIQISEDFHAAIFEMAGNGALTLLALAYHELFASMLADAVLPVAHRRHLHEEHLELANAISDGDAELAESLMKAHMEKYAERARRTSRDRLDEVVGWH